jgi:ankyrin repeat protein
VQLLLEHKASVDAKDDNGETALSLAAAKGYESVVRLLLEHIAVLHGAAAEGREAVVRLLLERKEDADAIDGYGWTPLHGGAGKWHEAVIRLLLERKADIEMKDDCGKTVQRLHLEVGEDGEYEIDFYSVKEH